MLFPSEGSLFVPIGRHALKLLEHPIHIPQEHVFPVRGLEPAPVKDKRCHLLAAEVTEGYGDRFSACPAGPSGSKLW